MKAMLLEHLQQITPKSSPLRLAEIPVPVLKADEVLIRVSVCGICHTELDEIEGRTPPENLPVIPGHQAVGVIVQLGSDVSKHKIGDRVGVAWIFSACGNCEHCVSGNENLCDRFKATGRDANGGYAEYMKVSEDYAHPIPEFYKNEEAAPLLCAGAVGYRALKLADIRNGEPLGLMGFGASAHLVLKLVRHRLPKTQIYVFARREEERNFALELGAAWTGNIEDEAPDKLYAIIDTTPVWKPVVESMKNLKKGGRLIINAIRKEDIDRQYLLNLSYKDHLWDEKEIKSVANVTAADVREFLELAAQAQIRPHIQKYTLNQANKALIDLKFKKIRGAKVLVVG
ncbi:MAG: zinc-dependent alcohol dehydrogenase family protein [Flavobacteriaceae bacterium]